MSDLKPCPFCGAREATDGNNASFSGVELMAAGRDRPYVWCGTCCASARMADTEAEAIAAWNTRTTDPAYTYAKHLAETIFARSMFVVPEWSVLDDTLGVLTQIDHMVATLLDRPDPAASREAALREAAAVAEDVQNVTCAKCGVPRADHHYRHPFVPSVVVDTVGAILALIDKPAPDHSAGAGNMIDKGAG